MSNMQPPNTKEGKGEQKRRKLKDRIRAKVRVRRVNWVRKLAYQLDQGIRGSDPRTNTFYDPRGDRPRAQVQIADDGDIYNPAYQSPEFPFVFVGGANNLELDDAKQKFIQTYGRKPEVIEFNVTDDQSHEALEGVTKRYNFPLSEPPRLGFNSRDERLNEISREYHNLYTAAAGKLAETIRAQAQLPPDQQSLIYVHCSYGMNRGPAVYLRAISELTNKKLEDTLGHMAHSRVVDIERTLIGSYFEGNPAEQERIEQIRQQLDVEDPYQDDAWTPAA